MAVKHHFNPNDNIELIKRFKTVRDTVQEEREKLEKYTQMLQQVQERMAGLKK